MAANGPEGVLGLEPRRAGVIAARRRAERLGKEAGLGGLLADHAAVASGWLGDYLVAFDDCGGGCRV